MVKDDSLGTFFEVLNYHFNNPELLKQALTHRSVGSLNNERLEFLGDAIIGFIIAAALYEQFPDAPEGELTRLRANLVKRETLAEIARNLDIGKLILLGSGEKKSGGWRRDSILSNTFEAIIGAIYLDSDFLTCEKCVLNIYSDLLQEITPDTINKDPKTELQEFLQARKLPLPIYSIVKEEGLAHSRQFTVECLVEKLEPIIAKGRSKRNAEQTAAQKALAELINQLS